VPFYTVSRKTLRCTTQTRVLLWCDDVILTCARKLPVKPA